MSQFLPLKLTPKAEWSLQQSAAAERVGQLNELGQSTYENAEISLADLRRQLIVGRNWKHILGLADILSGVLGHDPNRHYNHMMGMGLVPLTHLKAYMQAVESAYGQGLLSSPMEATTEQITNYFADVITDRELDGATIIDKYERGEIPLTPLEQEAFNLAQSWDSMLRAGQTLPPIATQSAADYQSVADKWDNVSGTTTVPIQTKSTSNNTTQQSKRQSQPAQAYRKASPTQKKFQSSPSVARALARNLLGNIEPPNTRQSTLTDASYIFVLLGGLYGSMQLIKYLRARNESRSK